MDFGHFRSASPRFRPAGRCTVFPHSSKGVEALRLCCSVGIEPSVRTRTTDERGDATRVETARAVGLNGTLPTRVLVGTALFPRPPRRRPG